MDALGAFSESWTPIEDRRLSSCGLAILQYVFEWLPPWGHSVTFSTHVADERITLLKIYVVFFYYHVQVG